MNEMNVATLITRLINRPLLIHAELLRAAMDILGRIGAPVMQEQVLKAKELLPTKARMQTGAMEDTAPGIAVIPVRGVLFYRGSWWGSSYEAIRRRFREAVADPSVKAIVLDIDSPGGEASGVFDLTDEIFEAREEKPIYAVANEAAYSAAYAIASAAKEVYLPRTGGMGSIGVIAVHVDQSGFDEKLGFKYTAVYAGKHKNDFSPHEPLSEEAVSILQREIDEVYDLFIETVARNRGLKASAVRGMEAGIFMGERAVKEGLADGVRSWDQAMEHIITSTQEQGGIYMEQQELQTQLEALITTPDVDAEAALRELGFAPTGDLEARINEAAGSAREEVMARVTGILDLCKLAGMPEAAAGLIKEGVSVEEARKRILEMRAKEKDEDEIVSTVGPLSTGETNPVLADARKRADSSVKNKN